MPLLILILSLLQQDRMDHLLNDWIATQNSGAYKEFARFVDTHYSDSLKQSISVDEQIAFFDAFYQDNGNLLPLIYEAIPTGASTLEVRLLKEGANVIVPDDEDIVIVRLAFNRVSGKLIKPLELTLLVCEQRGTYEN